MVRDQWLTKVLKLECFKFSCKNIDDYSRVISSNKQFQEYFVSIRTESLNNQLKTLPNLKIQAIQRTNTFVWSPNNDLSLGLPIEVRAYVENDLQAVVDLSQNAFFRSRFHQDERISKETAEEIKKCWVISNLSERSNTLNYVSVNSKNQVAGFISILVECGKLSVDLIAVHEAFRGKGFGSALLIHAQELANSKKQSIFIGTQNDNPAQKTYMNLGFQLQHSTMIWHDLNLVDNRRL